MRKFDYTFLKKISVPADIMNSATSIYEMKAKAELRRTDFADVFSAMEKFQCHRGDNHDGQAYPRHREQIHRAAGT